MAQINLQHLQLLQQHSQFPLHPLVDYSAIPTTPQQQQQQPQQRPLATQSVVSSCSPHTITAQSIVAQLQQQLQQQQQQQQQQSTTPPQQTNQTQGTTSPQQQHSPLLHQQLQTQQPQPQPQQQPTTPAPTPTPTPAIPSTPVTTSLTTTSTTSPQVFNLIHQQLLHHLVILRQQAAIEERFAKNGIQKNVHVVVKNSPFVVQVGQNPAAQLPHFDLSRVAFECALVYDTDAPDPQLSTLPVKYVDFVRVKPMEFKAVPTERGDQVSVELRIKVLTSQHEDMFFRVLIQGLDPISRQPITNLRVFTEPIKVISKPEQIKKRLAEDASVEPKRNTNIANSVNGAATPSQLIVRKRTTNDLLAESLGRIEQQQQHHGKILENLQQILELQTPPKRRCTSPTLAKNAEKEAENEFLSAFSSLLRAYNCLDPNQRPVAIRQLMRSVASCDLENFSEMIDMISAEGLKKELGHEAVPPPAPLIPPLNCEFEEFCKDFAATQSFYF